jgi:ATP-dependent DNA helicase RecG
MLFMKSKVSNISNLTWSNSLLELAPKNRPSKNLLKLHAAGIKTIAELIWLIPLRIQKAPEVKDFSHFQDDEIFLGKGTLISFDQSPSFGRRGANKVQLFNANAVIKDSLSDQYITFKWFNTYSSLRKQIESLGEFYFLGKPTEFRGVQQIVNPKLNPKELKDNHGTLIEYSTVAGISGSEIKKFISYIPDELWSVEIRTFTQVPSEKLKLAPLVNAFAQLHGKVECSDYKLAKDRIVYHEFLANQLKVMARKSKASHTKAPLLKVSKIELEKYKSYFPYDLTQGQTESLNEVLNDFKSGTPMSRMLQGDVGCGKTTVALICALISIKNHGQAAIMCPTETLARQHLTTFREILGDKIKIDILIGSTKASEKKKIYQALAAGDIDLIIGTHSLIQETVAFKNLNLAIIDEQHKFGVAQRQTLCGKGVGVHCLIMTATPIPRSLQLAQYGDLEISTIRSMPTGRKGTKTRIVTPETYEKYLSFIKTRVSIGEQVYIVVPAIEKSETQTLNNIVNLHELYNKYFPDLNISVLHGQLKSAEKAKTMEAFSAGSIDILISTTVIEVGINILNSTVVSIYNPDRFGLSSLHQLRGRVGRGSKAGFCFLIAKDGVSEQAMQRIKVVEATNDGFEIAEADLKNRGEGNVFGSIQSGHMSDYKLANIFEYFSLFERVSSDLNMLKSEFPEILNKVLIEISDETKITSTI